MNVWYVKERLIDSILVTECPILYISSAVQKVFTLFKCAQNDNSMADCTYSFSGTSDMYEIVAGVFSVWHRVEVPIPPFSWVCHFKTLIQQRSYRGSSLTSQIHVTMWQYERQPYWMSNYPAQHLRCTDDSESLLCNCQGKSQRQQFNYRFPTNVQGRARWVSEVLQKKLNSRVHILNCLVLTSYPVSDWRYSFSVWLLWSI